MWQYDFIQNAVGAALLASVACGVIGTYVVAKRMVFVSGGLAHVAFGGVGLAHWLHFPALLGACLFSLVSAGLMGFIRRQEQIDENTFMGFLWPLAMALGVLFVSWADVYVADMMAYLFGNILMVSRVDLLVMVGLDLSIVGLAALFFKQFQALCFDEEFLKARGFCTTAYYVLLLSMVALSVVLLLRVVGIVLMIALLTIPATISRSYVRTLFGCMVLSSCLAAVFMLSGLVASYCLDWPSGATTIVVACLTFFVHFFLRLFRA